MTDFVDEVYEKFNRDFCVQNFPDVFQWLMSFNETLRLARAGFSKAAHPLSLSAHPIFQTPVYREPPLMIVGNSNSWFDRSDQQRALSNLRALSGKRPQVNSYMVHDSEFGRALKEIFGPDTHGFAGLGKLDLLRGCVGLNRLWIQIGAGDASKTGVAFGRFEKVARIKSPTLQESFKDYCESRTRLLIDFLKPKKLVLMGKQAQALYWNHEEPQGVRVINCRHTSVGGKSQALRDLRTGLGD